VTDFFKKLLQGCEEQKSSGADQAKVALADEKIRFWKRIEFGINRLIQGNSVILLNNEFVEHLSGVMYDMMQGESQGYALEILARLSDRVGDDDFRFRERSVTVLSQFFDRLLEGDNPQLVNIVVRSLTDWLRVETEYSPSYDVVYNQLLSWGKEMLRKGDFDGVDYLLMTINHVERSHTKKDDEIIKRIDRVRGRFASHDIVDNLLELSFAEDGESGKAAGNILGYMSSGITDYLLEKLLVCEKRQQRFQLMRMITSRGNSISGLLVARLEKRLPWYFARNIIMMMSMIDDS